LRIYRQIPKIQNGGSNMTVKNLKKLTILIKINHFYENWYIGVSEVADYESIIRFPKFKMAESNVAYMNFEQSTIS